MIKNRIWTCECADIVEKKILHYGLDIVNAETFEQQDNFIQHGNITVKQHCISVARASSKICYFLRINCDERSLVRGALLHDYFLYDWHIPEKNHNWHGFRHANIAFKNANNDFKLNILEKEIIKKHMWPLTAIPPKCKEAWIVNIADTYCSLLETVHIHKNEIVYRYNC